MGGRGGGASSKPGRPRNEHYRKSSGRHKRGRPSWDELGEWFLADILGFRGGSRSQYRKAQRARKFFEGHPLWYLW